ncbi:MAG: bifunctional acetate--CoA ligase family protein/GNAT family N-acetyltransferase [Patescibacteria group bacterium]|nr:bifunctional acetate--CoA ligase family protein/GNAT family N-acetyltransferase [Patescibacteria group bacterium]
MNLDKLFKPKTIAVIGASDEKGSVGHALMDNLINSDYDGIIYPVNIKRESVHSIKAYNSVKEIPDQIDLVIIATPAKTVPGLVKNCGEAGVSGIVIISAGFQEVGKEGEKMMAEILKIAQKYEMRVLGPNCLGFMCPDIHLNATFANDMARPGKLAFISQSGALGTAILDWSIKNNVGFRYFVSIGSMTDLSFGDLIDYFGQDPEVSSILIYIESLKDARRFMSAARAFSRQKPIIVLKVGRTSAGAEAAKSHTGSMTGNDAIFNAAFERAGIIRVDTVVGLFHTAKALAMQDRPKGVKMTVITNAGGPGIIATDTLVYSGGELAKLEKATINKLNKFLPSAWSKNNPVDILGDASPKIYRKTLEICLQDKNTDSILVILTPQSMTDSEAVAKELVKLSQGSDKTILATWMGGYSVAKGREVLEQGNIPVYRQPEDAIRCFMNIVHYSKNLESLYETPATIPHAFMPNTEASRKIIDSSIRDGRENLTEAEAKNVLSNYGIPINKYKIAKGAEEAVKFSTELGFPVAMKILSPDILHKTDVGGVELNIESKKEAKEKFTLIMNNARQKEPKARLEGVFIEPLTSKRYEILIGAKRDPIFGPAIVFGMGGVAVEVFNDTKIGLPPLNMALSMKMIQDTKVYKLLKGYRGMPGVDISALQFLLYKFSYLLIDFPEIKEIDINPFAIDEYGGIVLDAKVVLDKNINTKKLKPYSHLVISPYPKEYISDFKLKNKTKINIRPIKPEDEPLEAEMFSTFSKETEHHRFFGEIKEITHELLQRYTQIDYGREIALIATATKNKSTKMIGVVRLIGDPFGKKAEFAIVVGDPWHKKGLGSHFTDLILEVAKDRGYKTVFAKYYSDNKVMEKIFIDKKFKISELDKKTKYAELSL